MAEDLLARIADGTFPVGSRLPTEGELCSSYGLARGTVRQALDRLRQLGMIERRSGVGTIVVAAQPVGPYQPFASTPSDIAALAATTRLVNPEMFDIVLDGRLARRLGTRPGTKWHVMRGVRVNSDAPDRPLCWSEHYSRGDLPAPDQIPFDLEKLTQLRVEQRVSATLLDPQLAAALDAPAHGPALVVTRRLSDRRGRVVNVGVYTHPADRYEITTIVNPGP